MDVMCLEKPGGNSLEANCSPLDLATNQLGSLIMHFLSRFATSFYLPGGGRDRGRPRLDSAAGSPVYNLAGPGLKSGKAKDDKCEDCKPVWKPALRRRGGVKVALIPFASTIRTSNRCCGLLAALLGFGAGGDSGFGWALPQFAPGGGQFDARLLQVALVTHILAADVDQFTRAAAQFEL
jgi:hypothetical protein